MAKKKSAVGGAKTPKRAASATTKAGKPRKAGIPHAPEDKYFVLVDGRRLGDIKELADALETMEDRVWGHHVNAERNDFASWVHDVFEDPALAERLRTAAGKHHAQIVLYRAVLERV